MNKPAMSTIRKQAQSGFTLIELIVVIVILGILAATALPRFSSVTGDARLAALNAARGALAATSASVHGQFLINPANNPLTYESQQVNVVNGYAAANNATALAAGLNAGDYVVLPAGTAVTANSPAVGATSIVIQPISVSTIPQGLSCFLTYTQAVNTNTPPVITVTGTTEACK